MKMLRPFFLPPGSSFGVWSHSPSPIPCLARRLPGGVGDRAPCGAAKWAQLLIYPPRLERSGLLAGGELGLGTWVFLKFLKSLGTSAVSWLGVPAANKVVDLMDSLSLMFCDDAEWGGDIPWSPSAPPEFLSGLQAEGWPSGFLGNKSARGERGRKAGHFRHSAKTLGSSQGYK